MKRVGLKHKFFAFLAVVMSFMVFTMPILAQQNGSTSGIMAVKKDDLTAGRIAGERDARANVNGNLWLIVGCFGGLTGLIVAYVYEPNPYATMLLGKSAEYVVAYTDAYRTTAKSIQSKKAITGCAVSGAMYAIGCIVYAIVLAATVSALADDI